MKYYRKMYYVENIDLTRENDSGVGGGDRQSLHSWISDDVHWKTINRLEESGGGGWQGQLMRLHPSGCSAPDLSSPARPSQSQSQSHGPAGLASTSSSNILQYSLYTQLGSSDQLLVWTSHTPTLLLSFTLNLQYSWSLSPYLLIDTTRFPWLTNAERAQWRRILHNFT